MQAETQLIDQIVSRVLAQLEPAAPAVARNQTSTQPVRSKIQTVQLSAQVITEDLLKSKWNGQTEIVVPASAVITPSGRDFLRQQKITLHRGTRKQQSETASGLLLVLQNSRTLDSVLKTAEAHTWQQELSGLPAEAATRTVSAICRGEAQRVILFTSAPELVACLCNRNQKIQAAAIENRSQLERVNSQLSGNQLSLNVIAVSPEQKSFIDLRGILQEFEN